MKKVFLCILDGFGYSENNFGNATIEAEYITSLIKSKSTVFLEASGKSVGLPIGQFGNSEVGHLTIGAGRILKQKLPLINDAIISGELDKNQKLNEFLNNIKNNTCHIMGLFSNGGVHSDISHFFWAIGLLRNMNINIKAHLFLDGRDVGYRDAIKTLANSIQHNKIKISEIATIQGRFFAMDRDNKLDRTKLAYDAIVHGISEYKTSDPIEMISDFYNMDINDEIIPQFILNDYKGAEKNDSFWMLNFRTDRIKQILNMIIKDEFKVMNMVDCGDEINSKSTVLIETKEVKNTLGEVLSKHCIKQLRIAETEKYAHVTYFFNGGKDIQYNGEDRILIPSPNVKDYSTTTNMSSNQITEKVLEALRNSSHEVIIVNFANADMIGHTGDFDATKESLRFLDSHIKTIVKIANDNGYITILTADHGNAENMLNINTEPQKMHTCSKVPFIVIPEYEKKRDFGGLSDIAPTILKILEINQPKEMTGESII